MLRSDPVQPGRISKHALRSMQRILAQPRKRIPPPSNFIKGGSAAQPVLNSLFTTDFFLPASPAQGGEPRRGQFQEALLRRLGASAGCVLGLSTRPPRTGRSRLGCCGFEDFAERGRALPPVFSSPSSARLRFNASIKLITCAGLRSGGRSGSSPASFSAITSFKAA